MNTSPGNGQTLSAVDGSVFRRFSRPLDPASVRPAAFSLDVVSVPGRPAVPFAIRLRQTRTGLVDAALTPLGDLPACQWIELTVRDGVTDLAGRSLRPGFRISFATGGVPPMAREIRESFEDASRADLAQTTAAWNTTVPGALAGLPGDTRESVGQSRRYDQLIPTPRYGAPEVDAEPAGGSIRVIVQGSRDDVNLEGAQPVDPDGDPQHLHTTDWIGIDGVEALDNYQYLRFRVVLTTAPDGGTTGRVPIVRELGIRVDSRQ